ncbi:MAG TPA: DUF2130 domain-containing protein [Burkholderiales bacterium]|nr:DUF2130 domain-containing protein [Burkholderiales bacterium]
MNDFANGAIVARAHKIVLSADQEVACPRCERTFPLREGITQKTIEQYESDYEAKVEAERAQLQERLAKDAAKKVADARAKAEAELDLQRKALEQEVADKDRRIREFQAQELALRREKKALEEARQQQELDLQRKLEHERRTIHEQVLSAEAEKFRLKEAEYRKKIEDAQKANEELTRKLEQGSQQLQGEVLELDVEHTLRLGFPHDRIDEVKKGVRGADVIQTVCTPTAQVCGRIVWEAKRAENWSDKWLQKLKDDQRDAKADIAVLVTTAMPRGADESFCEYGGVWVVAPHAVRLVAETLRFGLVECHKLRLASSGKNEKMELLYNYLCSSQFAQRVRAMVETHECMRRDLEAEKAAMKRLWAKRETQIDRASSSMLAVCGELQGIAHDSLPQLNEIGVLELGAPDDDRGVSRPPAA